MDRHIRLVQMSDISDLKKVIDSTELFPSEMLDDMVSDFMHNESSTDIWLTTVKEGKPVSVAYCAAEKFTNGTYNLLALGVHQDHQSDGLGREMMQYLEKLLTSEGHRVLLVETSGTEDFERTRRFYDQCGYTREAVIRGFYDEGDDKVIFWKSLT